MIICASIYSYTEDFQFYVNPISQTRSIPRSRPQFNKDIIHMPCNYTFKNPIFLSALPDSPSLLFSNPALPFQIFVMERLSMPQLSHWVFNSIPT
ncbi:hypothetical protein ACSBR2_026320 [Camellia fascicularis]